MGTNELWTEPFHKPTWHGWLLGLGFLSDVCLRHVQAVSADKNRPCEWLLFGIYWVQLLLSCASGRGELCTSEFTAESKDQLADASTGQLIWRDVRPPSEEVRQSVLLAWRVKSVLPLRRRAVLFLLRLPHLSLQSPGVSARFPPPCTPVCLHVSLPHHR